MLITLNPNCGGKFFHYLPADEAFIWYGTLF